MPVPAAELWDVRLDVPPPRLELGDGRQSVPPPRVQLRDARPDVLLPRAQLGDAAYNEIVVKNRDFEGSSRSRGLSAPLEAASGEEKAEMFHHRPVSFPSVSVHRVRAGAPNS